jgi:PKD repeat protein
MPDATPASLWIGAAEAIAPFKGWLDEVSIYRNALTATEVRAIANASLGKVQAVNRAPVVGTGGAYGGAEATQITFSEATASDPDGDALTYGWDFGDGSVASELNPRHTYADDGRYRVILTVSDGINTVADTTEAVISNVSPSATFVAPTGVSEGSSFQLSLTGAKDAVGDLSTLHYAFDCGAGYGGATSYATSPAVSVVTCAASADGPATLGVKARVFDKDGGVSGEYTAAVTIQNATPVVTLRASTATAAVGQSITFTGSFNDAGVSDAPWTYQFSWGDGTVDPAAPAAVTVQGGLNTTVHSYRMQGTYVAKFLVRDKDGAAGTGQVTITVSAGQPVPLAPIARWTPVVSPTQQSLTSVWGTSGSDVYAVGLNGTMLHYDGVRWQAMSSGSNSNFENVWGTSTTNVYAVGSAGTVVRYDGTRWTPMTSGVGVGLTGVWGSSTSNVYAVGDGGTIVRFDGTRWTPMPSGSTEFLFGVWGTSASNVYAVGRRGTILRFDGTRWAAVSSGTNSDLRRVWGTSATDVYAVGNGGATLRYDGKRWSAIPSGTTGALYDVWGTSTTNMYAVGTSGLVLRYDGKRWTTMRSGGENLLGVWGWGSSDAFAVGVQGTILRGSP